MAATGVLDLMILRRSTLWPDEVFSLAMATGHSVEHAAALANAAAGDFVQTAGPTDPSTYRRYIDHEYPLAPYERVTRAVFLSDSSPPLYYLLLSAWTRRLGTTDGALRSFSVFWALASIPFLLAIARRVGGPETQIPVVLFFVLSPNGVYYSTEGRMYSLLWFCVVATAYLTLRIREDKRSIAADALWILASSAGLLVHYFFIFPWCAMVGYLALQPGLRPRLALAARIAVVMMLILPWYRCLPASLHNWRLSGDWLNHPPEHFSRPAAAARLALQYFTDAGYWLWWEHPLSKRVLIVVVGLLCVVALVRQCSRLFAGNRLLVAGWLFAAWAGPVVFDLLRHTYTVTIPRYAIAGLPAAAVLGGLALTSLPRWLRHTVTAVIVAAWSLSIQSIYQNPARNDQPYSHLGYMLTKDAHAGDLVIVHSIPTGVMSLARYSQTQAQMVDWVDQLGTRTLDSAAGLVKGMRHVFLVRIHEVGRSAPIEDWLREHAHVVRDERWGNSKLLEFRPRQGDAF